MRKARLYTIPFCLALAAASAVTPAQAHEPHRVAFYLYDLAAAFHAHWNAGKDDPSLRFIHAADRPLTLARLALLRAVADVIASGLDVLGVTPVTEMR